MSWGHLHAPLSSAPSAAFASYAVRNLKCQFYPKLCGPPSFLYVLDPARSRLYDVHPTVICIPLGGGRLYYVVYGASRIMPNM